MFKPLIYEEGLLKLSKQYDIEYQYLLDVFKDKPYNIYTIRSYGNGFDNFANLYGCLDKHGYWWWQVQSGVPSQDFTEENYKFMKLATKLKFCPPNKIDEILDKYYNDGISLVEFVQNQTLAKL